VNHNLPLEHYMRLRVWGTR